MSGCLIPPGIVRDVREPIIQNGRIVGAVTHVMINDPSRGYGIFIESMIKNIDGIVDIRLWKRFKTGNYGKSTQPFNIIPGNH